jgi:glycosyltransferase involved in cell wall biosynthesis
VSPERRAKGSARSRAIALVAAHDEAERIAETVGGLLRSPSLIEVVVVDDGSSDRTAEEARAAGARVLRSPRNLGKGRALDAALERLPRADVYLLVDGDVAETAGQAEELLEAVLSGRTDLAIGCLSQMNGGGFGFVKRFATAAIRAISGFEPREPLSGQRAVSGDLLWSCRPLARGFGVEAGMTIDAVRLGARVEEIDVDMRHRPTGRRPAGFIHRGRQGLDIVLALLPRATGWR